VRSYSRLSLVSFTSSTLPYFKALTVEEVSRVIPLLQLTPVFVLILSSFFLRETLKPEDYVAFGLLVLGGILFAIRLGKGIRISLALSYDPVVFLTGRLQRRYEIFVPG